MKTTLLLIALTVTTSAFGFGDTVTNRLTGNWLGTLDAGPAKLRLLFKISQTYSGVLTAKLDSLDQGARDISVSGISVKDNEVRLEVKSVGGTYEGTVDDASQKITGTWKQSGHSLPLILERQKGQVDAMTQEKLSPAQLAASKLAAQKLAGVWNGTLTAGAAELHLKLRFSKTAAGAATGTLESVEQGAKDIPLTGITCDDGAVRFEAKGIGASFAGKLSPGGAMLTGEWHQTGQALPLEFKKSATGR